MKHIEGIHPKALRELLTRIDVDVTEMRSRIDVTTDALEGAHSIYQTGTHVDADTLHVFVDGATHNLREASVGCEDVAIMLEEVARILAQLASADAFLADADDIA